MAAPRRKTAQAMAVKAATKPRERVPAGRARVAVRGFLASMSASTRRLKAMAAVRAETMQTTIQNRTGRRGMPWAASTAPVSAKGRAKMLCSHLIIWSVARVLCQAPALVAMDQV